jgi:RNA polymerase sigma-70 factor (ECF subfamily)
VIRTAVQKVERLFESERGRLWGLAYRMTATAADADDVVQDTFLRALEHPPAGGGDDDEAWRPWLWRIAVNLAHDAYRRRRRRPYPGVWLPAAVETGPRGLVAEQPPEEGMADEPPSHDPPDARYDRLESVTYAFLLALEALTPRQRAVLLLCDVFDYSVRECAGALDLSESNVKVTHHRARAAMAGYEAARCRPDAARCARTQAALEKLVAALAGADVAAVEKLLAADVRVMGDGGGKFLASREPVVGAPRVARFYWGLAHKQPALGGELCMINGLPALVLRFDPIGPGWPARSVFRLDVDDAGLVTEMHSVLALDKLRALPD